VAKEDGKAEQQRSSNSTLDSANEIKVHLHFWTGQICAELKEKEKMEPT